jgi:putative ABC transport system ATP-binding protein
MNLIASSQNLISTEKILTVEGLEVIRKEPATGHKFCLKVEKFEAKAEQRICLVGRSGSGKTTFLEALGLLCRPTKLKRFELSPYSDEPPISLTGPLLSGQVDFLSTIRARTMGFVLQEGGLLPYLTVLENAEIALQLSGKEINESRSQKISHFAREMGLVDIMDRLPGQLSGGQRQRAAVLRAIAPEPKILLADEPTASLDPDAAFNLMRLLVATAETAGVTTVVVSHNEALMSEFGFSIYRIQTNRTTHEGEAALEGTLVMESVV